MDRRTVKKQLDIMRTYVQNQGKLIMQSRENSQKPNLGNILQFKVKYLQIANFSKE